MENLSEEIARKYLERRHGAVIGEQLVEAKTWINDDFVAAVIDCEEFIGPRSPDNRAAFASRMRNEVPLLCDVVDFEERLDDVVAALNELEAEAREREMSMRLKGFSIA